jgi:hypothetical protein
MSEATVRMVTALLVCLAVSAVMPASAYAYVDPGHGALVWQALLAAFFGSLFYLRRLRTWLDALRKKKKGAKETSPTP